MSPFRSHENVEEWGGVVDTRLDDLENKLLNWLPPPPEGEPASWRAIGIDPGLQGAAAIIGRDIEPLVFDVPLRPAKGGKNEIDEIELWKTLSSFGPAHVFLEKAMPMIKRQNAPGDQEKHGHVGQLSFGINYGAIRATVRLLGYPLVEVPPSVWKRSVGLGDEKNDSIAMALGLFPSLADSLKLKKHDGRAESLLLAWYGLYKLPGGSL